MDPPTPTPIDVAALNRADDLARQRSGQSATAGALQRTKDEAARLQREADLKNQAIGLLNAENERQAQADRVSGQLATINPTREPFTPGPTTSLRQQAHDRERRLTDAEQARQAVFDEIPVADAVRASEQRAEIERVHLATEASERAAQIAHREATAAETALTGQGGGDRPVVDVLQGPTLSGRPLKEVVEEDKARAAQEALTRHDQRLRQRPITAEEKERQAGARVPEDIAKEVLSLGRVRTATFNAEDYAKDYRATREELGRQYDKAKIEAEVLSGQQLTESRDAFLDRSVGTLDQYTQRRLTNEPTVVRLALGYIPIIGTGLAVSDTVKDWDHLSTQQKVERVALDGLGAVGDVVLIGGAARVAIKGLRGGTVVSRLTVSDGDQAAKLIATVDKAMPGGTVRPIERVAIAATADPNELRQVARLADQIQETGGKHIKALTIETAPTQSGIRAAIETDNTLQQAIRGGRAAKRVDRITGTTIIVDRAGADTQAIATQLSEANVRHVTIRTVRGTTASASDIDNLAQHLARERKLTGTPEELSQIKADLKAATGLGDAKTVEKYSRTLTKDLRRQGIRVTEESQVIKPTRNIRAHKIRTELALEPEAPRGTPAASRGGGVAAPPATGGGAALTRTYHLGQGTIPVAFTPGRVYVGGRPDLTEYPVPGQSPVAPMRIRPGRTPPTPRTRPTPETVTRPAETPTPEERQRAGGQYEEDKAFGTDTEPDTTTDTEPDTTTDTDTKTDVGTGTDPRVEGRTDPDIKPDTRPDTKPETQPATRTNTKGPGAETFRFRLPDGNFTPAGQYPRVIEVRQGFERWQMDLDTGKSEFTRTATSGRPGDTFRVVQYDAEPPQPRKGRLGIVDFEITPRGISFRQNEFARRDRQRSNAFRRSRGRL